MENIIIKEVIIRFGQKTNGKYCMETEIYHLINFSDEDTVCINLEKNFKHEGHYEEKLNKFNKKLLNMESGQLIEDENGGLIECMSAKEEIFYKI